MIQIYSSLNSKIIICLNICLISSTWIKIQILYLNNKCKIIWAIILNNKEDNKGSTNYFITVNINLLNNKWWVKTVIRHTIMIFKILNQSKKNLRNKKNNNRIRSLTNGKVITKMVCILTITRIFDFDPLIK